MLRYALLFVCFIGTVVSQTLTTFTPTAYMLPGKAGTYAPATFTAMCYDSLTRSAYVYAYYAATGEGYNPTIYSNSVFKVRYNPGATADSLIQTSLHLTANQNASSPYATRKLSGYYSAPTPFDRHAYFACNAGEMLLVDGLHGSGGIRDTLVFTASDVVSGGSASDDSVIYNTNELVPWLTRDPIQIQTSGTLPGGLSAGTDYFMIRRTNNSFGFATTSNNAASGTAINLTSAGTGTHTVIRSLSAAWYPSDPWKLNLQTGVYTPIRATPSLMWNRGYTEGGYTAVVWHRYWRKYFKHPGRSFENTDRRSWTFDPATNTPEELTTRGAIGAGTAPEIWGAHSMAYDDTRKRVWFFGDQDTVETSNYTGAGNSLWYIDTTGTWQETTPESTRPRMRKQHCVEYVPGEDKLAVVGGVASHPTNPQLVDVWLYDPNAASGSRWDSLETVTLPSGALHTYCQYDRYRGGLIINQSTDDDWHFLEIGTADITDPSSGGGYRSLLSVGR